MLPKIFVASQICMPPDFFVAPHISGAGNINGAVSISSHNHPYFADERLARFGLAIIPTSKVSQRFRPNIDRTRFVMCHVVVAEERDSLVASRKTPL